jgi:hypothetical protein
MAKKSRWFSEGNPLFILILDSHTNAMEWLFAHPKAHGKRLSDSATGVHSESAAIVESIRCR